MKEAKIIVRENYKSQSEEERRKLLKKNIARLLVRSCSKSYTSIQGETVNEKKL